MKTARVLLWAGLAVVYTTTAAAQSLGHTCRTPNGQPGTCLRPDACPERLPRLQGRCREGVCCPHAARRHRNLRLLPIGKCGPSGIIRIHGGNETGLNEFPWMVRLGYTSTRSGGRVSWNCGGSLINGNYVLTAAHCVQTPGLKLTTVRVGEHNTATNPDCSLEENFCNDPYIDLAVEQTVPHPQYSRTTLNNDIALVRLRGRVDISSDLRPICLPINQDVQSRSAKNQTMVVAGWGMTETGSTSPVLLKVKLPVVPLDECKVIYKSQVELASSHMCAGGTIGQSACGGDSGGPLMSSESGQFVQHGVVGSGTRRCASEGKPGVFTRVDSYVTWILDNLKA